MITIVQVTAGCPALCECPEEPELCPPGVSAVMDGCGCCKVCAAQLNQDCGPARPCDHHKGLECNYGNDVMVAWGICRGERAAGTKGTHPASLFGWFFFPCFSLLKSAASNLNGACLFGQVGTRANREFDSSAFSLSVQEGVEGEVRERVKSRDI